MKAPKRLLVIAICSSLLSGCAHNSTDRPQARFELKDLSEASYHHTVVQENGPASEVTLLRMQMEQLRKRLEAMSVAEREMSTRLTQANLDVENLEGKPVQEERTRIETLQAATALNQSVIAKNTAQLESTTARIDAELETKMAALEAKSARRAAEIRAEAERRAAEVEADMKLGLAKLRAEATARKSIARNETLLANSAVVAPVATSREVYIHNEDKIAAVTPKQASVENPAPASFDLEHKAGVTVKTFTPSSNSAEVLANEAMAVAEVAVNHSAPTQIPQVKLVHSSMAHPVTAVQAIHSNSTPQVIEQPKRIVYDVLYIYEDRNSWRMFDRLLDAHGIKDKWMVHNRAKGQYLIYVGRFNRSEDAVSRKARLASILNSDHAQISQKQVFKF